MNIITAPEVYKIDTTLPIDKIPHTLFLAGGISNCPDWQADIIQMLEENLGNSFNLDIFNPRRATTFNIDDVDESPKQIEWEHRQLRNSDVILFYFPSETLCPITLFEYGKYLVSRKTLFVGCHPEYKRKLDLIIQTRLERPFLKVASNIRDLAKEISNWFKFRLGIQL